MRTERIDVVADAGGVPTARRAAAAVLRDEVPEAVLDAAELVVSELVGNAVLHGAAPVRLVVGPGETEGSVRLEVHDGSRTLPVRPRAPVEGLTGRGLGLIDAVSAAWGVEAAPGGKAVWAELTPDSVDRVEPTAVLLDPVLAGFPDWPETEDPQRFTVTLGEVPTDLLVAAKSHVESLVRELTLTAAGAASGMSAGVPQHVGELVHDVVQEFAEARMAIKRQAVAAAERGAPRTTLTLTLPASAAEAGERYLAALEQADAFAREERLLTLAAPPQHRAFRRWYVTSLVDALRGAAAGAPPRTPPSFESHLLREIDHLAALQQVSERAARLQRATAALSGALEPAEVAGIVLREAVAELGAARGVVLVPVGQLVTVAASTGYAAAQLEPVAAAWRAGRRTPSSVAWTTSSPVWAESREECDAQFPGLGEVEPLTGAVCAVPLPVAGHVAGVLELGFAEPRLFSEDERAFLTALTAVGAQAFERADLYDRQAELAERLGALQEVTTALTAAQSEEAVLDVVLQHATGLVGARNAALCLLEEDGHTVRTVRMVPDLGPRHGGWATFDVDDATPASEALRTGEIVYAADLAERDRRWPAMARFARDFEHSIVLLPLQGGTGVLGVVSLSFPADPGREPDRGFLQAFADACGQALERARAGEQAAAAGARLEFLARASEELAASLDVERTLAGIARLSVPDLADWCVVHLLEDGELRALAVEHVDPAKTALAWESQRRWPERTSDPDGVAQVVRTGEPVLVPDIPALVAQLRASGVEVPQRDPEHTAVIESLGLRSCIIVPLAARGRTLGALTYIAAESSRTYGEEDLRFAQDLARRAAVALDNARLFASATQRAVAAGLPGPAEPEDGVAATARLLETMNDAFLRLDRQWRFSYVNTQAERMLLRGRDELLGRSVWDEFPDAVGGPFQVGYERAVTTGRQVTFEEWFAPLASWYEVRASPDAGGLSVFFHDVTVRKRAELEREQAVARLAVVADATRELVGALDGGTVLDRLAHVLVPRVGTWAVVAAVDGEGRPDGVRALHEDVTAGERLQRALADRREALLGVGRIAAVLATGRPVLVGAADPAAVADEPGVERLVRRLGFASAVVVPLRAGEETIGVLAVVRDGERPPFTAEDLTAATDIGARAGLALENVRLFEQQRTAVEVLQRSLLTALPEPDSLELTARYRAAAREAQVGGDWYDAFLQPDGATVLVIGDVMGHDVGAAAAMGQVRSLLRGTAFDRQESPARVLSRVDGALRGLGIETLATALVARLEQTPEQVPRDVRTLRWSSAGHPPAVVRRASGEVEVLAADEDLLLGLDPDTERRDSTVELAAGDTLLLYTDGLVERRDSPLVEGVARLQAVLGELGGLPLEELCDSLLARLLPANADDDVALVAVRAVPAATPVVPAPAAPGDLAAPTP